MPTSLTYRNVSTVEERETFTRARQSLWDTNHAGSPSAMGRYYHRWLARTLQQVVPKGQRVLEIGCGTGHLLAALEPCEGLGVDYSAAAIGEARLNYPSLRFVHADAHQLDLAGKTFDYIVVSDLLNDLWDVQRVLETLRRCCSPRTRVVINLHSHLWQVPLRVARSLKLASPQLPQNWLTPHDLVNLLELTGYIPIRRWSELLIPLRFPGADLLNRTLARVAPFRWLALTNFTVARIRPAGGPVAGVSVSIVVPARNESGNIAGLISRIPRMGSRTEVIFVEGNSTDDTADQIRAHINSRADLCAVHLTQPGRGKGDAVRYAFDRASGDVLIILDADMTVAPEDLPRFVEAMSNGTGEFVNGVRLVYPMQDRAMRFLNLVANRLFAASFSWLLGQRVRDTLCGTKAIWRVDYQLLARQRSYFGDFDPFGDFDLIFGAARLNLHMIEVPVRYGARTYGETNISRWRHGLLLLQMLLFAARRLKFA